MPLAKQAAVLNSQPLFQQRYNSFGGRVNLTISVPKLFWEHDTELNYDCFVIVSSQKQQGTSIKSHWLISHFIVVLVVKILIQLASGFSIKFDR